MAKTLSNKAKELIKNKLRPYLENDDFSSVVSEIKSWVNPSFPWGGGSVWEEAYETAVFLYELGVPVLEAFDEIPNDMFRGSELESVHIPSTIRVIRFDAFRDCSLLSELILEDGLEEIWARAFRGCSSLRSVVLPKTVNLVSHYAFTDCFDNAPIDVVVNSDVSFGTTAFKGSEVRLHVPKDIYEDTNSNINYFMTDTEHYGVEELILT